MLKGGDFARKTVELPRRLKRLISVCTDCVMIPLALWTAISLKAGHPESNLSDWPAFLAVIAVSIPIFIRAGLYRAVIRFLGHKAIFAVALSVAVSAVILGIGGDAVSDSRAYLERRGDLFRCRAARMSPDRVSWCAIICCGVTSCRRWRAWPFTARAKPARTCPISS